MKRFLGAMLAVAVVCGGTLRADDKDAILDKAIKALGGEEKLSKIKAASWKTKGKLSFGGNDNEFVSEMTVQGLNHQLSLFEGDFGGNKIKGVTVVAGDKGWRGFNEMNMELDKDALANEKRTLYLAFVPMTIVALKGKEFKVAAAADEKVGGKPAAVLKVTGPDGKDFTLFFDKTSGLPVKLVAKVIGFMGEEFTQETTYSDYKEMGSIQKATKAVSLRDGEKFVEHNFVEFKILDKVDPKTFSEPK